MRRLPGYLVKHTMFSKSNITFLHHVLDKVDENDYH